MKIKHKLILFCLVLILIIWFGSDGYREFISKKKNIKAIKIYNLALIEELTLEKRLSWEEVLLKSQVISMINKKEIDEFLLSLNPSYFAFQPKFFNCACQGSYQIVFEYFDETEYRFALAHNKYLKMPSYRDWNLDIQVRQWLKSKGITN